MRPFFYDACLAIVKVQNFDKDKLQRKIHLNLCNPWPKNASRIQLPKG